TEVCAKGTMTASPCCAVPGGTNVTLSCQLAAPRARGWCWAAIFLNSSEQTRAWGASVSKTFLPALVGGVGLKDPERSWMSGLTGISVSDPPDEPRNVSCIQKGTQGRPTCTWHKGRLTYLPTAYGIDKLDFDSNYTVVVSASNPLGNASSQPFTFMLIDIVKPLPPEFSVEFDDSSATSCTIVWHHEAQARHCRLRHRPLGRHGWSTVILLGFREFCSCWPGKGSGESSEPCQGLKGLQDSWGQGMEGQDAGNGWDGKKVDLDIGILGRNCSLGRGWDAIPRFAVALSRWEAGGRILCYNVTLESLEQGKLPAQSHRTTQTSFSRVTPRAGHRVTVTAHSPRGSSAPATVLTHLGSPGKAPAAGDGWGYCSAATPPLCHTPTVPHPHCVLSSALTPVLCLAAPSAGPQMLTTPWASGVLVSWEEIPAPQQRGCITGYHIYLHRKDGQGQPEVHGGCLGLEMLLLLPCHC
uniref:Uncharacterized protein n=1 Tax=Geospiza parvula TaxID=87175 RepID=A0A8U8AJN0_GEOPR